MIVVIVVLAAVTEYDGCFFVLRGYFSTDCQSSMAHTGFTPKRRSTFVFRNTGVLFCIIYSGTGYMSDLPRTGFFLLERRSIFFFLNCALLFLSKFYEATILISFVNEQSNI